MVIAQIYRIRGFLCIIFLAILGLIHLSSLKPPLTKEDFKCMRDEFQISAHDVPQTQNFGTSFRISFYDIQKTSKWIATPKISTSTRYLMIIQIRPENYNRRRIFRETIMSPKYSKVIEEGLMSFVFVCGKNVENEDINANLRKEAQIFGDILITEMTDSYLTLPFKVLSSLLFAVSFENVEIIGKYDEDVLLFPDQIFDYFEEHNNSTRSVALFGDLLSGNSKVNHNPKQPFYIPYDSYKCLYYAEYIAGPIYFMTKLAAKKILAISKYRKFISVEDCLITGLYAMDINAEMIKIPNMFQNNKDTTDLDESPLFTWHNQKSDEDFANSFLKMINYRCKPCRKINEKE